MFCPSEVEDISIANDREDKIMQEVNPCEIDGFLGGGCDDVMKQPPHCFKFLPVVSTSIS